MNRITNKTHMKEKKKEMHYFLYFMYILVTQFLGPLTAVGWGRMENFIFPHILRQVELPYVPLDECLQLYNDTASNPTDTTICAGNGTVDTCKSKSNLLNFEIYYDRCVDHES